MRSSFIVGVILSLSLQAKGITYCQCPVPWGAIKEQQEEQERRNRRKQLNNLFNELIKQGETVGITVGNMELPKFKTQVNGLSMPPEIFP